MSSGRERWISPRIEALRNELQQDSSRALKTFWQEVGERGTPLYEQIEGEHDHCLMTFVWRGDEQTRNIVLISSLAIYFDGWLFADRQMEHLEKTDLWYRTYKVRKDTHTTYQFSPNDPLVEPQEVTDWLKRFANFCPDPLNPLQMIYPKDEEIVDSYSGINSIVQGMVGPQSRLALVEGVPRGKLERHRLYSSILQNERRIWIYTPSEYDKSRLQPYGLLLLFDGFDYAHVIGPPSTLDGLIASQQIPPLVVVFIDNLGQQVRNQELACNQPFLDFLLQELMPWMRQHYHVTHDPQHTIIGGSSYGGLAAAFAGLRASHTFGNIIAQSGSFWWKPHDDEEQEWIIRQFEKSSRLPLRFSLHAGQWEPIVNTIRHMRDILQVKGYTIHYHEYYGGHDDLAWHDTFSLALQAIVHDWQ